MIDIHCHIVFGVDDGAKELNDSIDMAKVAVEEGITTIIATPHHNNGQYNNSKLDIINRVAMLNDELKQRQIPLTILPGQEPRIYGEILEDFHNGQILTLNNSEKYLFIELPAGHVPRYTEQLLFDIQMKGLVPIIVHPERNQEIIENPDILYQFVKKGACTQVTASSVAGYFGKKIKKFSLQLIEANLAHFIASDAHNISSRSFKMREAYGVVEKEFGMNGVYLFQENAELLIDRKTVYKEIPTRVKKRKLLGIFG
ncbi:tyrosine protein phosphatase [Cytobacillus sp. S13-E01]|uniref:tyrosine-protein phosphatase n=1 Tax=Cytobacillus sp. S13-E01 TaxID=3031326 RepID=UPI0023D83727|nr:CpsB/CapC family capsule biosynthesis tyrosine phosphatase [Cytobacillus sp. S13-E01]MDF0727050.1 tyrosine protein phosphatase [Cytobacillus sp. S13-E01]